MSQWLGLLKLGQMFPIPELRHKWVCYTHLIYYPFVVGTYLSAYDKEGKKVQLFMLISAFTKFCGPASLSLGAQYGMVMNAESYWLKMNNRGQ